jgi:uncharacterized protein (DUF1697 family)
VATYIQSGNVVFTSDGRDPSRLAAELESRIGRDLGVRPAVVVLSRPELERAIHDNPFPAESDPKRLHAVFTARDLNAAELETIEAAARRARTRGELDEARAVGRTLYLHTPDGLGRSRLAAELARVGDEATARNWATVTRLAAMLSDQ